MYMIEHWKSVGKLAVNPTSSVWRLVGCVTVEGSRRRFLGEAVLEEPFSVPSVLFVWEEHGLQFC